jgi:hypothetical protein
VVLLNDTGTVPPLPPPTSDEAAPAVTGAA